MSDSFVILTNAGLTAFGEANSTPVVLSGITVGGTMVEPTTDQTAVVNLKWTGGVVEFVNDTNKNQFLVSGIIPAPIGGFVVGQVGLTDQNGTLLAIAKGPGLQKAATAAEGEVEPLRINLVIDAPKTSLVSADLIVENQIAARAYTGEAITIYSNVLEAHEDNLANPHQVTKAQVGLGSVENFPTATQAEAEAGLADNRFMTPTRVAQAITKLATAAVKSVTDLLAPLASPVFTGTPKAPTAARNDSSTQLATTEFVSLEGWQYRAMGVITDATKTFDEATYCGMYIEYSGTGNGTWTLWGAPTDANNGKKPFTIKNNTTYTLTLATTSGIFKDGTYSASTTTLMPGETVVMFRSRSNWNFIERHNWAATVDNDRTYSSNGTRPASTGWLKAGMASLAAQAGFAYSFTTNGYFKFPSWFGGFILQWGIATCDTTGLVVGEYKKTTITFPIAFPNSALGVVGCNYIGLPSGGWRQWSFEALSLNGFILTVVLGATYNAGMGYYYLAFGK